MGEILRENYRKSEKLNYCWQVVYDDCLLHEFKSFVPMHDYYLKVKKTLHPTEIDLLTWRLKEV